jgi:hypothetical protein
MALSQLETSSSEESQSNDTFSIADIRLKQSKIQDFSKFWSQENEIQKNSSIFDTGISDEYDDL